MRPAADTGAGAVADPLAWPRDSSPRLLLICRIGDHFFGLPASTAERILRMAALTPLPCVPGHVVGVLNLQGGSLPVVDPRPRLGLPTPRLHLDQRLVIMSAATRYVLWVDEAERIASVQPEDLDAVGVGTDRALVPFILRLDGATIPVLSPEALDPGPIVQWAGGPTR